VEQIYQSNLDRKENSFSRKEKIKRMKFQKDSQHSTDLNIWKKLKKIIIGSNTELYKTNH
jgi:hypothetical protein